MKRHLIHFFGIALLVFGIIGACSRSFPAAEAPAIAETGTPSPSTPVSAVPAPPAGTLTRPILSDPSGHTFSIRYMDVGQADAALVECDGHYMLIDGGNTADSSRLYATLNSEGVAHLDYIVNSHPHEDHVGGLAGALNACTVDHVLCPVSSYDSMAFDNFKKYTEAQGKSIDIPAPGDQFELGVSLITILGPIKRDRGYNDLSIVLRIDYGDTSFLFTGDIEREAEMDLLEAWDESALKTTVLKVAHHGSDTSTSYYFLWAAEPSYAVISVGADNTYGHPSERVLSRLSDADVELYRTDLMGDIFLNSDGNEVVFTTEKSGILRSQDMAPAESGPTEISESYSYIGNLRSHKFHLTTCVSLPVEKNRIYFETYEEAMAAGYSPCMACLG